MNSLEFAKRMRKLTGKIYVYPFRLCEGAPYVLRAKLQLRLAGLLTGQAGARSAPGPAYAGTEDRPLPKPQRVAFREQVVAARQERDAAGHKRTERDVANPWGSP